MPAPATAPAATAPAKEPTPAEVAALVKQLGDDRFQAREAAQKELIRLACPEAYEQVQQAAKSQDAEVAQRAGDILKAMGPLACEWAGRKVRQGLLWQRELKGGLCWPVVPAGAVVCVRGPDGTVRGLDARTGKDLWSVPDAAAMAVDGKSVFLIDANRTLVALDPPGGKGVASFRPQANAGLVRLAAAGGTVYVSRIDVIIPGLTPASAPAPTDAKNSKAAKEPPGPRAASALLALDGATGKCRWQHPLGQILVQDPIVADGVVYVVCGGQAAGPADILARPGQAGGAVFGGEITALDAATGGRKWSYVDPSGDGGGVLRCLGVGQGKVCVSTGYWTTGLDAAGGKLLWRTGGRSRDGTWAALPEPAHWADGVLYTMNGGMFTASDMARGGVRWTYRPELPQTGQVTTGANGTVTINGGTIVLNGGTLTVTVGPGGGGVAILNGKVVATSDPAGGGLSLPTPVKDTIVFAGPQGLQAVSVLDWTTQWCLPEKGLLPYRPILADGVIYFAARAGGGPSDGRGPATLYALRLPGGM